MTGPDVDGGEGVGRRLAGRGQGVGHHRRHLVGRRRRRAADADDDPPPAVVLGAPSLPARRPTPRTRGCRPRSGRRRRAGPRPGRRPPARGCRAGGGRPRPGRRRRRWRPGVRRGGGRRSRRRARRARRRRRRRGRAGAAGRARPAPPPSTTSTNVPRAAALARTRSASSWLRSTANTRRPGAARAASMATLPLPAPTSHNTPVAGRSSLPSTTDRTSGLVIIDARWAKSATGRPPRVRPISAAPPGGPRPRPTGGRSGRRRGRPGRCTGRRPRPARPGGWPPRPAGGGRRGRRGRRRPLPAGASGPVRTAATSARATSAATRMTSPVWQERTTAVSHGRPRRAKARATDDGAGCTTRRSLPPRRAARARTMPKNPGSPDARTTAGPGVGGDLRRARPVPRPPRRSGHRAGGGRPPPPAGPVRRRRGRPRRGRRWRRRPRDVPRGGRRR